MKSLKESLQDWEDLDGAQFELGISLGIFPEDAKFSAFKSVFWTRDAIGYVLFVILVELVETGILLNVDGVSGKYRWNPEFSPDHEKHHLEEKDNCFMEKITDIRAICDKMNNEEGKPNNHEWLRKIGFIRHMQSAGSNDLSFKTKSGKRIMFCSHSKHQDEKWYVDEKEVEKPKNMDEALKLFELY